MSRLLTQIEKIQRVLQQPPDGEQRWSVEELTGWLLEGEEDFQAETGVVRADSTVALVEDQGSYDYPSDCLFLLAAQDPNGYPVSLDKEHAADTFGGTSWRTKTGNRIYNIFADRIRPTKFLVYPIPDSDLDGENLNLQYIKLLSSTRGDFDDDFPARYLPAVRAYCLAHCFEKEIDLQNLNKAQGYWKRYQVYVGKARAQVNRGWAAVNAQVIPVGVM